MRTRQQLSISQPDDEAESATGKVLALNRNVESWLAQHVGAAYDALKADPSRAISVDQLRARLAAEHAKAL